MPTAPKPLISAAFICERVLKEDSVYSAIRIVDTFTVRQVTIPKSRMGPDTGQQHFVITGPAPALNVSALIMVKAGDVTGIHKLSVSVTNPDNKETRYPQSMSVQFLLNDPAEGATLNMSFVMDGNSKAGLYWINVWWD